MNFLILSNNLVLSSFKKSDDLVSYQSGNPLFYCILYNTFINKTMPEMCLSCFFLNFFSFLRQSLTMETWLAWDLLYRLSWPRTHRYALKDMYHYNWHQNEILKILSRTCLNFSFQKISISDYVFPSKLKF